MMIKLLSFFIAIGGSYQDTINIEKTKKTSWNVKLKGL
jgi:hypothetical protein